MVSFERIADKLQSSLIQDEVMAINFSTALVTPIAVTGQASPPLQNKARHGIGPGAQN